MLLNLRLDCSSEGGYQHISKVDSRPERRVALVVYSNSCLLSTVMQGRFVYASLVSALGRVKDAPRVRFKVVLRTF